MDSNTQTPGSFRLPREVSADTWQSRVVTALTVLECAEGVLVVDCSEVGSFDDAGIAMLIGFARYSERRDVRVLLANPPEPLRTSLERRGLTWLFDWSPRGAEVDVEG